MNYIVINATEYAALRQEGTCLILRDAALYTAHLAPAEEQKSIPCTDLRLVGYAEGTSLCGVAVLTEVTC